MMDAKTAVDLNLPIVRAESGSFGCYSSPGKNATPYYGIIRGPIELQFGPGLNLALPFIRLIDHPFPLFLIGSDILRAGIPSHGWTFVGILNNSINAEVAHSYLVFSKEGKQKAARLISSPSGERPPFRVAGERVLPHSHQ